MSSLKNKEFWNFLKHKNYKFLQTLLDVSVWWVCCLMKLVCILIHFCPSDVFCLPSQIPSASLKVRSFCRFFCLTGSQVPLHLKITCIARNQVPSVYEKSQSSAYGNTWRLLMKHENAYPPHRPTFWLVLKSNKSWLLKIKLWNLKNILVNFQWPSEPSFPWKIQVYVCQWPGFHN